MKKYTIVNFILFALCIVFTNIIATNYFFRIDLTEEKRYAISDNSKIALKGISDVVFVKVYLEGDLPAGFKRLQRSIREMLDEFRVYGGNQVQYKFIDPLADATTDRQKGQVFMQLGEKGLQPTNIHANEGGKQTEKLIFPGAVLSYKGKETSILFLKGSAGANPAEVLNQSVEGVEFELISAIKKLSSINKARIGIVEGHGELSIQELEDITASLKENYNVDRINLQKLQSIREYFDVLIIAKPQNRFSEADKLKIDQFIVNGGKALFLVDKAIVDERKLGEKDNMILSNDLNLDDLLFRYGVRINSNLIKDLQSGAIPMVTGLVGDKPQTQLVPWNYYPVYTQFSKHPIVKNMSAVIGKYANTIDTVKSIGIKKTPLMFTSKYVKELTVPAPLDLNDAKKQPEPNEYASYEHPVGYLLEGKFQSLYTNRLSKEIQDSIKFKPFLTSSKIIVFSDGDLIRNDVSPEGKQTFPLGYDRYMRKRFANKDLLLNCITFLADENGIINSRSKEIKLRPLDKQEVKDDRFKWQIINVLIPIFIVLAFGLFKYYRRKNKYEI